MIVGRVLSQWKESLALFQWSQFRLFLLVSCNTMVRGIWLLARYFWWLGGISLAFLIVRFFIPWGALLSLLLSLPLLYLYFVYVLVMRPSLERKDETYFASYSPAIKRLGAVILLNIVFFSCLGFLLLNCMCFIGWGIHGEPLVSLDVTSYAIGALLSPFLYASISLGILFVLDAPSDESIFSAFYQSMCALGHYLPAIFILGLLFPLGGSIDFIVQDYISNGFFSLGTLLWIGNQVIVLFGLSLMVNYYLKIKYSNYKLFFS